MGGTLQGNIFLLRCKAILKKALKYLNPFRNFKTKLLFCFVSTVVLEMALGIIFVRYITLPQLENDAKDKLGVLASQMASRMDRFMWERYQQVLLLAAASLDVSDYAATRKTLDLYYNSYTVYSFFGIANTTGTVIASAHGILENVSVKARPWFGGGMKGPYVGDVHLAALLQSIIGGSEVLRFVDVAVPVKDKNNNTVGVLGAHLSWNWAKELSQAVINQDDIKQSRELFVTARDFTVLLTPRGYPFNATAPYQLNFTHYPGVSSETGWGYIETKWPVSKNGEGNTKYVVGVSHDSGYNDYPGLGWKVLLRQPTSVAFEKAKTMYYLIVVSGVCMMVVFICVAILLSWQLTKPIMQVVQAADEILAHMSEQDHGKTSLASGKMSKANKSSATAEVKVLFNSLQSLVSALDEQAQLMMVNTRLQEDVLDYTAKLVQSTADLECEKMDKALVQGILFNVLPSTIAERLKKGERILADNYDDLTIFFSDIVGFTPLCEKLKPVEVVMFLDDIFSRMDALTAAFEMDRIRTIGDSYFAVGGMKSTPTAQQYHTAQVLCFASCVLQLLDDFNRAHMDSGVQLNFRMGIHCGACVGSVIGTKQVSFDLWGDSINVASRMESTGEAGRIQVSSQVYERAKHLFDFQKWEEHEVKGRGMMVTYFLVGPRSDVNFAEYPPLAGIHTMRKRMPVSTESRLRLTNVSINMPP